MTRGWPKCSGGNTELTKTSLRDQEHSYLLGRPSRQIAPTDVQLIHSSLPVAAHRRGTKFWRAQEVEGQCFRKHPESSLTGTGTLCPEQLREPAEFCSAASPTHLQPEACRRNQDHTIQESQGWGVDPSWNVGSLGNAVRTPNCRGWVKIRPFSISDSGTHSILWKRRWYRSQKSEPAHRSHCFSSFRKYVLNVLFVEACLC